MSLDWVALLGPGGLIALLWTAWKIIEAWKTARAKSIDTAITEWQELSEEKDARIARLTAELNHQYALTEYWRTRAGRTQFLLLVNGVEVPTFEPEPPRPRDAARPRATWAGGYLELVNPPDPEE